MPVHETRDGLGDLRTEGLGGPTRLHGRLRGLGGLGGLGDLVGPVGGKQGGEVAKLTQVRRKLAPPLEAWEEDPASTRGVFRSLAKYLVAARDVFVDDSSSDLESSYSLNTREVKEMGGDFRRSLKSGKL